MNSESTSGPKAFDPDPVREAALLKSIANGDRSSFHELHQRYAGVVYSTVHKVLNNAQDTEDVSQEVFASIWRKSKLYNESRGKPLTWVATMARNRAIDRLRSKQRRSRLQEKYQDESKASERFVERDSSILAFENEQGRIVRKAVAQLSCDQREAIELAYFSGMTQNEIAVKLDKPLGTVKARIRRGILRLKDSVSRKLGS